MKAFFKNNLLVIILFLVGTILLLLSNLSIIVMALAMGVFALSFGFLTLKFRKKYVEKREYDPSQDYFDATSLGYDEEVYYIGSSPSKTKEIKGKFASLEAMAPFMLSLFLTIGFVFMALYTIFKYII